MGRYVLRRLLTSIPVLLGVTLFIYFLMDLAPGDPVTAMIPPELRSLYGDDWIEREYERLGLDKPWLVRYGLWLRGAVTGNLGYSIVSRKPVVQEIARLLPRTLKLAVSALLVATAGGLIVGVVGALKQYSLIDHILTLGSFTALSVPNFFLSLVLIYVFALALHLLPSGGTRTVGNESLGDSIVHMILPTIALAAPLTAGLARYMRSSVLDVLSQDYVTTARSKGLSERTVIVKHVLRNSLLPFVTITGMRIPYLIAGSIVIEYVFFWPGVGQMSVQAVLGHDYPVVMGINLLIAIVVMLSNLITDVTYAIIDPRIRYT
jgi:peptide/nickel transport system permease protein